jgi:hypothetical protein
MIKYFNLAQRFGLYRTVNTHSLSYKNKPDLLTEKRTLCCEVHIEVTNTGRRPNVKLLS